jgi:hypothetical protein
MRSIHDVPDAAIAGHVFLLFPTLMLQKELSNLYAVKNLGPT